MNIDDNQKRIEEMAERINGMREQNAHYYYAKEDGKLVIHEAFADGYAIAEELIKHYQPKIPENSIVLREEEYNTLLLEQKRLREIVDRIPCGYVQKEEAEKQAVKEYCDKLKKVIHERDYVSGYAEIGLQEEINEIAKEMGVEL